jgi:hypothetical protein
LQRIRKRLGPVLSGFTPVYAGIDARFRVLERLQAAFFQKDEPLQVVAGRFEVQHEGGAHDTHAAHEFSTHMAHGAEDVFDAGPWRGDPAVALLLRV